jgi:hypothetical protein
MRFLHPGSKMIISLLRALLVAVALFAAFDFGEVALGQSDTKIAEQQSKPGLEPLLGQITSRNCPEISKADVEKAVEEVKALKREIPDPIQELLVAWLEYSKYYKHMHYVISIAIIVFGALATALRDEDEWWKKWKTMAAVLATISAAVNTTLTPSIDYKKFDQAFVVLNTAKAAYATNPYVTLCDVGKSVAYGESLIHKGE